MAVAVAEEVEVAVVVSTLWRFIAPRRPAGALGSLVVALLLGLLLPASARSQESGDPILRPCSHPCPAEIRFAKRPGQLDRLVLHARINPASDIDPSTENFTIALSNLLGLIDGQTLAAGTITAGQNGLSYFNAPGARVAGGIARLRIRPRRDPLGGYRVDAVFYGDLSLATEATMTTLIRIGDDLFSDLGTWTQTPTGWVYEFPT